MNEHTKQQLFIFAIIFILMDCMLTAYAVNVMGAQELSTLNRWLWGTFGYEIGELLRLCMAFLTLVMVYNHTYHHKAGVRRVALIMLIFINLAFFGAVVSNLVQWMLMQAITV